MAQLFTLPKARPLTTAGRVMPASKLYFYLVGTSTLAAIYSDADCSVQHANPVVADGNGEFAAIYLNAPRDCTLKTSTGTTMWGPETVGTLPTAIASIEDYGASPDNTALRPNSRPPSQFDRPSSGRFRAYWPSTHRVNPVPTKGASMPS